MAKKYQTYDTVTKQLQWSPAPGSPADQDFDVGVGGQTSFVVTATIGATGTIDVCVDGRLKREGASYDFTRNTSLNSIVFNFTVPQNSWVRVRVY